MNLDTLYSEPRIYAFRLKDYPKKVGWLKVGYTAKQTVSDRVAQELKIMGNMPYEIVFEEKAVTDGGLFFDDNAVFKILEETFGCLREKHPPDKTGKKGKRPEWFRTDVATVAKAVAMLRKRTSNAEAVGKRTFGMRPEQARAVAMTAAYFRSHRKERGGQPPSFLWNAKMRFGKTFTTYQLANEMGWKRILVLTFKPAVEDSWQTDLEGHADFNGWKFIAKDGAGLASARPRETVVRFGSFQDFLQLDPATGEYKERNKEAFAVDWDCVVVDEYHFGAWRSENRQFTGSIEGDETEAELGGREAEEFRVEKSPLSARNYLMLSGTPFRAIKNGEFAEDQVFNWTYSDEQREKEEWSEKHPGEPNPYASLPRMNMLVYRLPDKIAAVAENEDFGFDLNEFFRAERDKDGIARFVHENEVGKWLDFIRGEFFSPGPKPTLPYYDAEMKRALRHTVWYLPNVSSCEAMAALLGDGYHRRFYGNYEVNLCAGSHTGIGKAALESVENVRKDPLGTLSITLTCGKLTTGVTIPAWSAIFMLRSLSSPESYFQAAFRVQSPWTMKNLDGRSPDRETILKENCYVFDFALNRALRQIADYSANLSDKNSVPAENVREFINFMPVICYDGSRMAEIDSGEILDLAYTGMSGPAMARRWNSSDLLNITPAIVSAILNDKDAMAAIGKIEGFANPRGDFAAFVNQTRKVGKLRTKARSGSKATKKELTEAEKELRRQRSEIEKKLKKFATRIPIFMYLSNYREKALKDVIENLETELFTHVTGLTLSDFETLVDKGVFNSAMMNSCIWQFRAYEEESLDYMHMNASARAGDETLVGGWDSAIPVVRRSVKRFDYGAQFQESSALHAAAEPPKNGKDYK